jgi:hypothetical protein
MKLIAFIYTLMMFLTLLYVPYQLPIPKVGGEFDAGYHWSCNYSDTAGISCARPNIKPEDSSFIKRGLEVIGLEKFLEKDFPIKYRVNNIRLISEWLFITFLTLIWMLAFRTSNRPHTQRQTVE